MSTKHRWLVFATLCATSVACACAGDPTVASEPRQFLDATVGTAELGVAYQVGELLIGESVFFDGCPGAEWKAGRLPLGDPILLDLVFPGGPFADPRLYPFPQTADSEAVVASGAEIVHQFHVAQIRALVPRASLAALIEHDRLGTVRVVPNPERRDVLIEFMVDEADRDVGRQRFVELGGAIFWESGRIPAFRGIIPDVALPAFEALGDTLEYVRVDGHSWCTDVILQ